MDSSGPSDAVMHSALSPPPRTTTSLPITSATREWNHVEPAALSSLSSPVKQDDDTMNSPFVADLKNPADQENTPLPRNRHSRVLSGSELSPLKILSASRDLATRISATGPEQRSPRKMSSPDKRFPVKISDATETPCIGLGQGNVYPDEPVVNNASPQRAIEIYEDESNAVVQSLSQEEDTITVAGVADNLDEPAGPDDTMVSTFSTFSAVPNMTMLARIGHSPTKSSSFQTPRAQKQDLQSSKTSTISGPLPLLADKGNTTNLLVDFTDHLRCPQPHSPAVLRGISSQSRTMLATGNTPATPARLVANLLDFDIPPLPTPRSIPTITPRELESLKSNFLSEISSLKASLSGKEAEANSLKTAVMDAEKRVGESKEQLLEERAIKDQLLAEKESWEKRGREMEAVLRKAKDEIVLSQRERDDLEAKLDESEKRREAAEIMAQEAESKMAGMRAGKVTNEGDKQASPAKARSPSSSSAASEVEVAVERVARELHALYKSKHETKVTALKKSYENRWEKRVRELEAKISELTDENDGLRAGRDATMTKVDAAVAAAEEVRKEQATRDSASIKELQAEIQKFEAIVQTVEGDNAQLRKMLERERVEKGELVQLAEEMMAMQAEQSFVARGDDAGSVPGANTPSARTPRPTRKNSVGRSSGLKMPGTTTTAAESRIARMQHERARGSGSSLGLPRPGQGFAPRSGIMSSIEKMGSYGRRGD